MIWPSVIGLQLWDLGGKGLSIFLSFQMAVVCRIGQNMLDFSFSFDIGGLLNWSSFFFFFEQFVLVCPFVYFLLVSLYHILRWHKIDPEKHKRVADIT